MATREYQSYLYEYNLQWKINGILIVYSGIFMRVNFDLKEKFDQKIKLIRDY